MINGPMHAESSSARQLLGTGRPLCVICGVRPAFNNGRKAYPTCGLTCASHLNALMQIADDAPKSDPLTQHTNKPLCVNLPDVWCTSPVQQRSSRVCNLWKYMREDTAGRYGYSELSYRVHEQPTFDQNVSGMSFCSILFT
ncbi:hypothetical protein BDN70DRAFT_209294 [Pholiota conissans]|uniref:Uncharacterized protein n=1 Tax=Pholiota conissans TaxID=109636 RepID=A0A9P5YU58_9AGAR|nr:hypothetical protein BDN70DRAFT_209294 [Pholiota conissans]